MAENITKNMAASMARSIMIQGTASNAGKSLLVTALCRIFRQDGYRVAPFKSQNMALNSFITEEGLEMGRAQAVQAEAAGIVPCAGMNPILLKPTGDRGSLVIVNGKAVGHMRAADYFTYRGGLRPDILAAYHALAEEYEIVVIEGAGSPAEINLKDDDIVNMGMAKMARSPVLLAADIDRGGVFASVYGTVALLDKEERRFVRGTVINKFRGDVDILRPGLVRLEELTDVPVLGVVPYLQVDIDDEDSLSERLRSGRQEFRRGRMGLDGTARMADIVVIRLPRMANVSDFHVFERMPEVVLRYAERLEEWGCPDLVILPGTQNVIDDLDWLRQRGLEAPVLRHAALGGAVWGIGGGCRMLGRRICDPEEEGGGGERRGMGLLDGADGGPEGQRRVTGRFREVGGVLADLSGVAFAGYEIGGGGMETESNGYLVDMLVDMMDGGCGGCQVGSVYGTYVHGIFDKPGVARAVVRGLLRKKGRLTNELSVPPLPSDAESPAAYREKQYDKLAEAVRASVDMARIYDIIERGM